MCLAWWQARLFGRGFELSSKGHEWDVSARDRTALMTWKSIWSGARNIATRPFSRMWRVVFETCFAKSVRPMTFRLSKAMWARITFISMFPILPNYPSVRWSSVWKVGLPKWSRLNFRNWEQSFGADTSGGLAMQPSVRERSLIRRSRNTWSATLTRMMVLPLMVNDFESSITDFKSVVFNGLEPRFWLSVRESCYGLAVHSGWLKKYNNISIVTPINAYHES